MTMTLDKRFTVAVVGGFAAYRDGRRARLRPSAQRLVALLAVEGRSSRLDAGTQLWTDIPQDRTLANLRTVLWRLRQDAFGLVLEDANTLELGTNQVDLLSVRCWANAAVCGEDKVWPIPDRAGRELLPGWSDAWLIEPREELHLVQLHALEATGRRLMMEGRLGEACGRALAAVRMDPLRESATRLLVEIHLREGNNVDAIRRFQRFECHLRDEADGQPSPALIALVAPLLARAELITSLRVTQGNLRRR